MPPTTPLAPSPWLWAAGHRGSSVIRYQEIIDRAIRVPDPTVRVVGRWLVRRLAPHCTRIELGDLIEGRDEARLLHAMGYETANVHIGTLGAVHKIRKELDARKARWLHDSAKTFSADVTRDWRAWRSAVR